MSATVEGTPNTGPFAPGLTFTVAHYNGTTNRWHVEEEGNTGTPWATTYDEAWALARGYQLDGFPEVKVITAGQLKDRVESLPYGGSLVAKLDVWEVAK